LQTIHVSPVKLNLEHIKNITMNNVILRTQKLTKTFVSGRGKAQRTVEAVRGVDLEVYEGEIFGFLGPNGAGKTTTLNMVTTLLAPSSGQATVVGNDLLKNPIQVRQHIGYVSQAGGSDTAANAYENLILQARLYGIDLEKATQRAKDLVERFQMSEFADRLASTYSGGQRRRLDLALGIVHHPPLVFLDEPTIGLDPQSRAYFWDEIIRLKKDGMTIFVTTHYLDEADNLCDRLAIIDHGHIVAVGTGQELKKQIGAESIVVGFQNEKVLNMAKQSLENQVFVQKIYTEENKLHLFVVEGEKLLAEVLRVLDKSQVVVQTIELAKPSLDDVFLQKTGRSLREQGE